MATACWEKSESWEPRSSEESLPPPSIAWTVDVCSQWCSVVLLALRKASARLSTPAASRMSWSKPPRSCKKSAAVAASRPSRKGHCASAACA